MHGEGDTGHAERAEDDERRDERARPLDVGEGPDPPPGQRGGRVEGDEQQDDEPRVVDELGREGQHSTTGQGDAEEQQHRRDEGRDASQPSSGDDYRGARWGSRRF